MDPEAPWKRLFTDHVKSEGGYPADFCLATIDDGIPRARILSQQGFISLPVLGSRNMHAEMHAERESVRTSSDCPTFATAASSNKVAHIITSNRIDQAPYTYVGHSGGGGPVEGVWWFKKSRTQWRLLGNCYLLASHDSNTNLSDDSRHLRAAIARASRLPYNAYLQCEDLSWESVIQDHYAGLPGPMQKKYALHDTRVGVIIPYEVELLDLNDMSTRPRWLWKKVLD